KNSHNLLSIQYRNHYDVPVCKMACSPRWKCSTRKSTGEEDMMTAEEEPTLVVRTYPNPFVSKVSVDLYNGGTSPIMVKIYSADGSEVFNKTVEPVPGYINAELELNGLQKGIYFMKIFTSDGKLDETIKLMKQ
ncbi:MAG TPA: T9SS type A sorting domain-containing protein, partial [Bacteroidales bacterium]|nr:T9SS type A sorting domain-containing protein [Bacteroidales bacterium]